MDLLSEVLSLFQLTTFRAGSFVIPSFSGLAFGQHSGIKCYVIAHGMCCVCVEHSQEQQVELRAGDAVLLLRGQSFTLKTHPSASVLPFSPDMAEGRSNASIPHDGDATVLGGHFIFASAQAQLLLQSLPELIHVKGRAGQRLVRYALEGMAEEIAQPLPGGSLAKQHLASLLLLHALRQYLEEQSEAGVGWLYGLTDGRLLPAFKAMHDDARHPWSLQELANRVGMSRTIFAQRFKQRVGMPAIEYLIRWRMLLAGERLRTSEASIAEIALSLGYEGESAFARAFRKVWKCSPKQHRRDARGNVPKLIDADDSTIPCSDASPS